jgi:signal transduction histidine kinase
MFEGGEQAVVNMLGHAAGVFVFGIFLYLIVRERSMSRLRAGRLSLVAAALALLWNLASLAVLAMGSEGSLAERAVAALGFSGLSMLPAVLLQLCLLGRFPLLVRLGYGLSVSAVAAHMLELEQNAALYHRLGLWIITIGFGVLTAVAVLSVMWSGAGNSNSLTSRVLAAMSLFLFAVSFVHFGDGNNYQAWSAELAVHHAGIPLALFILLHDFRFVLLDAFIRFLVNGLLAGLFGVAIASLLPGMSFGAQALTAGLIVAAFALAKESAQKLLTRLVFRQPDQAAGVSSLQALRSRCSDEAEYLRLALQEIALLMKTKLISFSATPVLSRELIYPAPASVVAEFREGDRQDVRVVVPVRLSHGDLRYALLGERRGGQPYLSEDLDVLARLAACVGEQVERMREAEVQKLVSQAELRALQSQIHPHFLFNALNTLYGVIPREAGGARRLLLNLSDIFRYFLQTDRAFVPLEEELRIVDAYLAIEKARLGDKLQTEVKVETSLLREPIPVLSIQPLVENAVKHGAAARTQGGQVRLEINREGRGLRVTVSDTGPGFEELPAGKREGTGVGLENVSRRLGLCYGQEAGVRIDSSNVGSRVSFLAPLGVALDKVGTR